MAMNSSVVRTMIVAGLCLFPVSAYAGSETDELSKDLEDRYTAIESDRKSLNEDCNHVSGADTQKMQECGDRHADVRARMDLYKKDLARLKRMRAKAAATKSAKTRQVKVKGKNGAPAQGGKRAARARGIQEGIKDCFCVFHTGGKPPYTVARQMPVTPKCAKINFDSNGRTLSELGLPDCKKEPASPSAEDAD